MEPITAILAIGGKLIDRFFPDETAANAAKLELLKMHEAGELAGMADQAGINKVEAANPSLFVSGWRPFIGWICGAGLGYQFIFYPVAAGYLVHIQQLDMGTLLTLLGGMLGLGGLRTAEKLQGVAAK